MTRVLVIDDEIKIRSTISTALGTKKEFEVVTVESGEKGLRAFERSLFDLTINDRPLRPNELFEAIDRPILSRLVLGAVT